MCTVSTLVLTLRASVRKLACSAGLLKCVVTMSCRCAAACPPSKKYGRTREISVPWFCSGRWLSRREVAVGILG